MGAGSYPEGKEDFPVGGISWYEAAAYARFTGKELPTIYHWYRATRAAEDAFADILKVSNFDARGPVKVGERQSVGVSGTYDTAGNVKEWCANRAGDSPAGTSSAAGGTSRSTDFRRRMRAIRGAASRVSACAS